MTFLLALPCSLCLRCFYELDKPQGQGAVKCCLMVHSWSPALFGGLKTAALRGWGCVPLPDTHPCAMSELLQERQSSVPVLQVVPPALGIVLSTPGAGGGSQLSCSSSGRRGAAACSPAAWLSLHTGTGSSRAAGDPVPVFVAITGGTWASSCRGRHRGG